MRWCEEARTHEYCSAVRVQETPRGGCRPTRPPPIVRAQRHPWQSPASTPHGLKRRERGRPAGRYIRQVACAPFRFGFPEGACEPPLPCAVSLRCPGSAPQGGIWPCVGRGWRAGRRVAHAGGAAGGLRDGADREARDWCGSAARLGAAGRHPPHPPSRWHGAMAWRRWPARAVLLWAAMTAAACGGGSAQVHAAADPLCVW